MKYSKNDARAGEQAELDAHAKEDPGARTRLPM
jgi:hypothetical protein